MRSGVLLLPPAGLVRGSIDVLEQFLGLVVPVKGKLFVASECKAFVGSCVTSDFVVRV